MQDWSAWHARYDDPESPTLQRLAVIQGLVDRWLDATAPRPVRVLSICAGDGRDLVQILGARADAGRATVTLVESDPGNAARAREEIARRGLTGVTMGEADASRLAVYAGAVPADLVVVAGVFGNIEDRDTRTLIRALPELCARDALVVWTRRRKPPGIIAIVESWFAGAGFVPVDEPIGAPALAHVGAHRFVGEPRPLGPDRALFAFTR